MMQSLRTRLLVWLLVPLLVVSAIALTEANSNAARTADAVYDRLLAGSALAIAERVVVGTDGELQVDVPYVALEMLISAAQDRVFYRVQGPGNAFITGYRDLAVPDDAHAEAPAGTALFYDARFRGAPIRIAALAGAASGDRGTLAFEVLVAETTGARQALAREMLVRSGLRQGALIIVALLVLWFGTRRALRPLKKLEDAIDRRGSGELRPITWPVPLEVRHLVGAINDFMARLDEGLEAMRRFTGNASHQLRTPLSVIKTQIALAENAAGDDKIKTILTGANAAAAEAERVVAQLLMLARLDEAVVGKPAQSHIDIVSVLRVTTGELVPGAHQAGLDLGFEALVDSAEIACNPTLIAEVVRNLVSNAVIYAGPGAVATVRVLRCGKSVVVEVEDDGPGIAPELRARATERFVRLPGENGTRGAGLGLAIVAEIARIAHARLTLEPGSGGKGLAVRLTFPGAVFEPVQAVKSW